MTTIRMRPRTAETPNRVTERIQKALAGAGHGSRRKVEQWIREGRLQVDGRPAQLGDKISGRTHHPRWSPPGHAAVAPSHRHIVYNKPEGEIVAMSDPDGPQDGIRVTAEGSRTHAGYR